MRTLAIETIKKTNQKVILKGWVNSIREHGKIVFVDLRDISGIVQVVFSKDLADEAKKLSKESVIEVKGEVKLRPSGMVNPDLPTGEVEVKAEELKVLAKALPLPIPIDTQGYEIDEEKRLRYRYLDLRRARLKKNLIKRHQVLQFIRNWMTQKGFVEIETPHLTKSTPEGARDFLVPSRLEPGKFYALPQSPQQYKQLLQVAGFEKYFQIARCFRDEDPRGDRQAEFTQLDIEMSFVEQEDVLNLIEELLIDLVKNLYPEKRLLLDSQGKFPRISYQTAIEKFKTDKPDLRKNPEDNNELAFCFIVDFPMFEWKEGEQRWDTKHHPFTQPQVKDVEDFQAKFKEDPSQILAFQYDLVLNGYEVGGGSIRITDPELLLAVFSALGHSEKEIKAKFAHMLEAFQYGVPPHGGIAPGIDRLMMILEGEPNIREVIAFPKTGDNRDLMMGAPSEVLPDQLKELHLKIIEEE